MSIYAARWAKFDAPLMRYRPYPVSVFLDAFHFQHSPEKSTFVQNRMPSQKAGVSAAHG